MGMKLIEATNLWRVLDHLHESFVGRGPQVGGGRVRPVRRLEQLLDDRVEVLREAVGLRRVAVVRGAVGRRRLLRHLVGPLGQRGEGPAHVGGDAGLCRQAAHQRLEERLQVCLE